MSKILASYKGSNDPGYRNGIMLSMEMKCFLTDCEGNSDSYMYVISNTGNKTFDDPIYVNNSATYKSDYGNIGILINAMSNFSSSDTEKKECTSNPDINNTGMHITLTINEIHTVEYDVTGVPFNTATYKKLSVQGPYNLWYTIEANWYYKLDSSIANTSVSLNGTFGCDSDGLTIHVTDHEM